MSVERVGEIDPPEPDLFGSMTRNARLISRLRAEGPDDGRLACPIGLPQLRFNDPEVIAVSGTAHLLMRMEAQ